MFYDGLRWASRTFGPAASEGFPEGLLDQPFYGWVEWRLYHQPVLTGFTGQL
jgi:hypothetical protein